MRGRGHLDSAKSEDEEKKESIFLKREQAREGKRRSPSASDRWGQSLSLRGGKGACPGNLSLQGRGSSQIRGKVRIRRRADPTLTEERPPSRKEGVARGGKSPPEEKKMVHNTTIVGGGDKANNPQPRKGQAGWFQQ